MRPHTDPKRAISSPIPTVLGVLLGLLFLSASLFLLDRQENRVLPSAANTRPTGITVFAELLRRQGYEVAIDNSFSPRLDREDLIVRCRVQWTGFWGNLEPPKHLVDRSVDQFVARGGSVLEIEFSGELLNNTEYLAQTQEQQVSGLDPSRPPYRAKVRPYDFGAVDDQVAVPVLVMDSDVDGAILAALVPDGKGSRCRVTDGSFLTNRAIDMADHARMALSVVRAASPHPKRIVFVEASLINAQPSLWQELGPWANAFYWQVVCLMLVIAYSLGKRFGPPIEDVIHVRGSRELLVSFGDLMRRANRSNLALDLLYGNLDLRVRRAINLPIMADEKDRDARLSPELVHVLHQIRRLSKEEVKLRDASKLARHALSLVENLEKAARSRRAGI